MVMVPLGRPVSVPYDSILRTKSSPFVTLPKTVCLPFSQGVSAVQMKTIPEMGFFVFGFPQHEMRKQATHEAEGAKGRKKAT